MDRNAPELWPERLAPAIARSGRWRRLFVLDETKSTQDAARARDPRAGDIVAAVRQTGGRGRLGRAWADTTGDGLAVTFVIDAGPPERLAIATAVGVADALQTAVAAPVRIKWPNDVIVGARKLAGILVEQDGSRALVGVGVNVHQGEWAADLAARAVSCRQLGAEIDRVEVLERLLAGLDASLAFDDRALASSFLARDVLVGLQATFRWRDREITGEVRALEPLRGLLVRAADGEIWLPAATTSVRWVDWPAASRP